MISSIEKAFLVRLPDVKDILFLVTAISTRDMVRCNIDGKLPPYVVRPPGQISANDTKPYDGSVSYRATEGVQSRRSTYPLTPMRPLSAIHWR